MGKKGITMMVPAIIAVVFLVVFVLGFYMTYSNLKGGLSKEKIECEILDFIPFICSDANMQQLQQQQQQQISQQQQQQAQQYATVQNDLFNHVIDLYKNCGINSPKQKCVCEFDAILFEADKRLDVYLSSQPGNKIRIYIGSQFQQDIPGTLYIDEIDENPVGKKEHKLVDVNNYGATRSEYRGWVMNDYFIVKVGDKIISETKNSLPGRETGWFGSPDYDKGIGILKDGNNRGLYVPYDGPNEEVELC